MTVHRTHHPQEYPCLFCGERLEDWFFAWYRHVDSRAGCREAWFEWMGNVRREAGGT